MISIDIEYARITAVKIIIILGGIAMFSYIIFSILFSVLNSFTGGI